MEPGPVVGPLTEIVALHERHATQVALRWLLQQSDVLPIPGAKNADQARANARTPTFTPAPGEVDELATATRGWRGTKSAWLSLIGFATVIFNFTIVNLYFQGLHAYSGVS